MKQARHHVTVSRSDPKITLRVTPAATPRNHPKLGHRYEEYEAEESREIRILLYAHYRITYLIKPDGNVDLIRDFAPVGQTGNSIYTLCASKQLGADTLAEVIARAKAAPGELKIGSVGLGSAHHLIAEMLKSAAGSFTKFSAS